MEETITRRHSERSEESQEGDPQPALSAAEGSSPQDDEEVKIRYTYRDDNTPQAITLGDSTYYYLTDGHGDVREITDSEGTTLVKYSYNAFGSISTAWIPNQVGDDNEDVIPTSSSVIPAEAGIYDTAKQLSAVSPYTYASYRYDQETGMYYLRARYYDSVTGRFLSKDPILKESISKQISDIGKADPLVKDIADELVADIKANHPYAYGWNNPINYVDPDGLHVWVAVAVVTFLRYYPWVYRRIYYWRVPTIRLAYTYASSTIRRVANYYYVKDLYWYLYAVR